jgi:hypothetical protein
MSATDILHNLKLLFAVTFALIAADRFDSGCMASAALAAIAALGWLVGALRREDA